MKKNLVWLGMLGVLVLGGIVRGEDVAAKPEPLRLTLLLNDGSKIIGEPALAALPLRTDYTQMDLPLVKLSAGATNAVVSLANGDKLSAVPGLTELKLTTLYGKVVVPLKLIASLAVSAGGVAVTPREGLVLWFPFDGMPGAEVADASGHEHGGKLMAGARVVADEGRRRDVLELDGRGAHIRVPGSPDFCLTNLTFAVWLKPAEWSCEPNAPHVILSTVSLSSFDGWEFFIGGPHLFCWHTRLPEERKELATPVELAFDNDEAWHFLACTFYYTDGHYTVTTFCDGQQVKQEEHVASPMGYSGQEMHIGINYDSPAAGQGRDFRREFQGRMDDLMLFNRALSEPEIAALFKTQK